MQLNSIQPDKLEPGMTITIPGFVMCSAYGGVLFAGCTLPGYTTVGEHTIVFTVPENYKSKHAEIAALEEEIERVKSEQVAHLGQLILKKDQLMQKLEKKDE